MSEEVDSNLPKETGTKRLVFPSIKKDECCSVIEHPAMDTIKDAMVAAMKKAREDESFKLKIIDDGSKDSTLAIAYAMKFASICKIDKRICIVNDHKLRIVCYTCITNEYD